VFNILREQEAKTISVFPTENAVLGFMIKPKFDFNTTHVDLDLDQSITEGFAYGYWTLHDYVAQFKYIFTKKGVGLARFLEQYSIDLNYFSFYECITYPRFRRGACNVFIVRND